MITGRVYAGRGTVARSYKTGARVEIQDYAFNTTGRMFTAGTDPVDNSGYLPGDMWLNTYTGSLFRME